MEKQNDINFFKEKKVRTIWDETDEKWFFSIIDVIAVLTESVDPNAYWRKLKITSQKGRKCNLDKLSRLENDGNRWQNANDRCSRYRTTFSYNSIYTFSKSRAI
jgi:hypothetical protein